MSVLKGYVFSGLSEDISETLLPPTLAPCPSSCTLKAEGPIWASGVMLSRLAHSC